MLNPKFMEAWYSLMAEAMKGTQEAQEAFQSLSKISGNPEAINGWMAKFMPGAMAAAPLQSEGMDEWLEETWRMMGVVPRSRYLELLEKNDQLQRQLEKAEKMIENLRASSQGKQEQEAKEALETWSSLLEDTLKAQTEWMQNWLAASQKQPPTGDDEKRSAEPPAKNKE